jgi:hypothetical protein
MLILTLNFVGEQSHFAGKLVRPILWDIHAITNAGDFHDNKTNAVKFNFSV